MIKKYLLPFVICSFVICHFSFAFAADYDGIWFMGFNINKPPFDRLAVRQAVAHGINKEYITMNIVSGEVTPASFIPPGMTGYDPELSPYIYNLKYAKTLMRRAKYPPNNPALKRITLLHTDGVKTIAIAQRIRVDLKQLGMKVELVQVSYRDEERWNRELASRRHQLFLMGYKADLDQLFSAEATNKPADSYLLLSPLFVTGGEANLTGYSNPAIDTLLDQVSVIGLTYQREREEKLKQINKLLYKELPAILFFYIEKF